MERECHGFKKHAGRRQRPCPDIELHRCHLSYDDRHSGVIALMVRASGRPEFPGALSPGVNKSKKQQQQLRGERINESK
jgi:hypothetical protein